MTSRYRVAEATVLQRPVEPKQYRAIRYTERLAEAEAVASVGSKVDQPRLRGS
jgi:hypothetical protein